MKEITLTRGYRVFVDDDLFDDLSRRRWTALPDGQGGAYAVRKSYGKALLMHRHIAGARDGELVDHISRDTSDNRRENLRIVSRSESNINRRSWGRRSRFRGVGPVDGGFVATITVNGEHIYLGFSKSEEECARRYNDACRALRPGFSILNEGV